MSLAGNPMSLPRVLQGAAAAVLTFLVLGTVTAVWPNPVFVRMTPTQGLEIWLLAVTAAAVVWEWRQRHRAATCPVGIPDQNLREHIRPS